MPSILDFIGEQSNCFGVDTETYRDDGECGLKSIQVYGSENSYYFTSSDFSQSSDDIRREICAQFFKWIESLNSDSTLAFFNLDYDASQFLYYLVRDSGYEYTAEHRYQALKTFAILESDMTMYKISIRNGRGRYIKMIDCAKFLTATTLDKACSDWIGERKIVLNHTYTTDWISQVVGDMTAKSFAKAPATKEQHDYAMKDAELTYRLYNQLCKSEVIEPDKYITIAGRTMGHFKDYIKTQFSLSFSQFAYGTDDTDFLDVAQARSESVLRPSLRGGICRANRVGLFYDAHHIDAKSHYPSQGVKPYIPHGPILEDKPNSRYEVIYFPVGYFKLKKGKLPYFQWKRKSQCFEYCWGTLYKPGEYVSECYLDGTYAIWGMEWEIIKECYDIFQLDLSKQYYIEMAENTVLKPYFEMIFDAKENNTGTKKYFYKILLNSLYGKFLSRPDGIKISYENGVREKVEETDRQTYYLPLGSWIATGGRVELMKAMLSIDPENVLYCDTDSMIYTGDTKPAVKYGKSLGCWDIEHESVTANIVGPKTYQEQLPNGEVITKCAGMSKSILGYVPFGELKEGLEVPCLKTRRDKGSWAMNLEPTTFRINTRAQAFRGVRL